MIDYLLDNFDWLLICMSIAAVVVFVCLFFVDAGYGKFYTRRWGPSVGNRLGWMLMELPVFVLMLVLYIHWEMPPEAPLYYPSGLQPPPLNRGGTPADFGLQPPPLNRGGTELSQAGRWSPVPLVFLILFELHYFQRSLVFPFLLRGKNRMPLAIVLLGVVFNCLNAFMQAGWLFCLSKSVTPYPYTVGWLLTPQFIVGTLLFFAGMGINLHSDHVIRQLRQPGDTRHYLPSRGLYRYVTSANYFGELVEWCGFALLTWSWSGVVFALWTFANLAPRAYRIHKCYQADFPEQMAAHPRKRMIPYVWTVLPLLLVAIYFLTIVFTPYLSFVRITRRYCPAGSVLMSISVS